MAELKYDPVPHNQKAFLEKASKRRGFRKAYDALEVEYALAHEMLSARTRAGGSPRKQSLIAWALPRAPFRGLKVPANMHPPWHHSRSMPTQ
jgi:hypothetical protein